MQTGLVERLLGLYFLLQAVIGPFTLPGQFLQQTVFTILFFPYTLIGYGIYNADFPPCNATEGCSPTAFATDTATAAIVTSMMFVVIAIFLLWTSRRRYAWI